jgi:hypothetical protein
MLSPSGRGDSLAVEATPARAAIVVGVVRLALAASGLYR